MKRLNVWKCREGPKIGSEWEKVIINSRRIQIFRFVLESKGGCS